MQVSFAFSTAAAWQQYDTGPNDECLRQYAQECTEQASCAGLLHFRASLLFLDLLLFVWQHVMMDCSLKFRETEQSQIAKRIV